ncbi:MAG: restriction endonuclease subunit S [bacterium]|nr:restriction endonuclease subunit S [bacterium]
MADAPNGIAKLRQLILQLAVTGKLVRPEGKDILQMQNGKSSAPIDNGVASHNKWQHSLNQGWHIVTLGEAIEVVRGVSFSSSQKLQSPNATSVPCLRTTNVQDSVDWFDLIHIPRNLVTRRDQLVRSNDILISLANSRELVGKVSLVSEVPHDEVAIGAFISIIRSTTIEPKFLLSVLRSPSIRQTMFTTASQTVNIANISVGKIKEIEIALPPLPEQHRIVAKVDELMKLCDELEAQKKQKAQQRTVLVKSALSDLTSTSEPKGMAKSWQRISDHFNIIFDTPETVKDLRQAILQLAVTGKLVPQDPKDEPAEKLLERINIERESNNKVIPHSELQTESSWTLAAGAKGIPTTWVNTTLATICGIKSGNTLDPTLECKTGIPYLKVADMNIPANRTEVTTSTRFIKNTRDLDKFLIPSRSIIFPKRGGAIATNKKQVVRNPIFADLNIMAICCPLQYSLEFLSLWFNSFDLSTLNSGTSVPQINHKDLAPLTVPVPPLAEQHRIVAKVDELMKLCDELEPQLRHSQSSADQLFDAVVAGMMKQ